ncbi:bifunctional glutamate N-acetyltransferase/amino-acid acetyltransferase ArgJ [Helicobacter saguini]|uniref:Arginine biosynthesis bifunctional protein ArgJ n=1 Tax=Helicobacter saguini TaxID=1548018 RepID=A0A347VK04_9HELI|nr:bifunctional glutamate N-acetyltransferase/amino-acid acetyltransferase ArgJ [Helicobacter saguini]MWV60946.1 bifunctional glutamate N-acetyltransferase/amino-acid acetyltransferase ArgJ [Helicobacter saguini]MWV68386.1 bifunctional glutamate N-acetyltransferase/amino-acid acetyltransferase ArgJ [Helicobacter saguini]MWV70150.1 bifunctional glutamate N-acetyltransferase/amino-acid acetyltransferase ArgJ [Helicobacter saguini]MWV72053.1 bifunctional glutamate N-acetyltransferase/amino-acid ac
MQDVKEDSIESKKAKVSATPKDSIESKSSKISKTPSLPQGFKLSGIKANIKYKNRFDLALIYSKSACVAAGVWTKNKVQAACISYNKAVIDNNIHAIMINSGFANACTGLQGDKNCIICARGLSENLSVDSTNILLASTGVIGQQLPMDRILKAIPKLVGNKKASKDSIKQASRAIMTTDTYPKTFGVKFALESTNADTPKVKARIWGMAKGSGMIHPNMGTMLGFILTDAAIDKALLNDALSEVVNDSFNQISVDGDTSTNDMAIVLANGKAGNALIDKKGKDYETFKNALKQVCVNLAKKIARDGEGATHLLEVVVKGARDKAQARALSKAIIGSNLVKTAIFGKDANWGRIICAMGYSNSDFDAGKLDLSFESKKGSVEIVKQGVGVKFSETKARSVLGAQKVRIIVNLNDGKEEAKAWGCDLSYDYIKINADYRS